MGYKMQVPESFNYIPYVKDILEKSLTNIMYTIITI